MRVRQVGKGKIDVNGVSYPRSAFRRDFLRSRNRASAMTPEKIRLKRDLENQFAQQADPWSHLPYKETRGGCWNFQGSFGKHPYGVIRWGGRSIPAHRAAYAIANGSAGDLMVCHRCDNPKCINPEHLFAGSAWHNYMDGVEKGRINQYHLNEVREEHSAYNEYAQ